MHWHVCKSSFLKILKHQHPSYFAQIKAFAYMWNELIESSITGHNYPNTIT